MQRRGYSSKVVADIVGHASVATTEQIYVHADDADFRAALVAIASELLPDVTKSEPVN
ncbi:MAG TPA: hypothetical protein VNM68_03320 [Candidatus Polarisedimenticolia bacterium]|nr:hypothetical protein [Candidatus Polarisedimenticolia bacterium]